MTRRKHGSPGGGAHEAGSARKSQPAAQAPGTTRSAPAAPVAPASVGWDDVVAESRARVEAERPVEPQVGDLLQHPALGLLEVLDVGDTRIEVRDRARIRRKLARPVLEFRLLGERHGKRVLKVVVRGA